MRAVMEAAKEKTAKKIVIKGLVQGIGYRPFVAGLAEKYGITGWVKNTAGIVTVMAEGKKCQMEQFLLALKEQKPEGARVDAVLESDTAGAGAKAFVIEASASAAEETEIPFLPPDLPTCPNCRRELLDSRNRRYRYPFISCTSCGPRYSILERIPYDRPSITMRDFALCEECQGEYQRKGDVRRHAQTIACQDCGPALSYVEIRGTEGMDTCIGAGKRQGKEKDAAEELKTAALREAEAEKRAALCLRSGGIVAVKDIGGFHLACSPYCSSAVEALRQMKGREKKPFAVLFPDIESVGQYCSVDLQEEEQLLSVPRPIVLLAAKECQGQTEGGAAAETTVADAKDCGGLMQFAENVCGLSPDIGAMLPCNPLQILLAENLGPLVMTSANCSGELIITENEQMLSWMLQAARLVDVPLGVLQHERRIVTPLDDSVVRIAAKRRQVIRRARGMVPEPVKLQKDTGEVFAAGGDLKACFCFAEGGRAYLSQHLGDLQDEESYRMYERETERIRRLFGFSPKYAASDLHPAYMSVKLTERMHAKWQLKKKVFQFQHHFAHGASVIAEHGLQGKVLCVAFDGTGYGTDGSIWGSEFLLWDGIGMKRMAHLIPVHMPGGDEGARNTKSILYGYFASFGTEFEQKLKGRWEKLPWLNGDHYRLVNSAIACGVNTVVSSSMGRLFDAVSALLDICGYNEYEGEAPIELEYLAAKTKKAYPLQIECTEGLLGNTEHLFQNMIDAVCLGVPREELARGFIVAVADFVHEICSRLAAEVWEDSVQKQAALGGGTFQNRILLEETIRRLEAEGFQVYMNEQVPAGDGGICLGQAYLCGMQSGQESPLCRRQTRNGADSVTVKPKAEL